MNFDNDPKAALLSTFLQASVPLLIWEYSLGRRVLDFERAHELSDIIAYHGDAILYRVPGKTAQAAGALAEALSIMAFVPNGVRFLGVTYEATPEQRAAAFAFSDITETDDIPSTVLNLSKLSLEKGTVLRFVDSNEAPGYEALYRNGNRPTASLEAHPKKRNKKDKKKARKGGTR